MKSGNAEERSSGLENQSLGPKDREGVLTTLRCKDNNAARQCNIRTEDLWRFYKSLYTK
jgi:hypothetical protein